MAAEQHINWFALEKACEKAVCPLCTIVAERSDRYIDNMLFEHVSDRGFRAKYRASGGFCADHAKHLDSFRDGLAVAILGEDILHDVLPSLHKKKVPQYKGICPACEETDRVEREFLGFIAECSDPRFVSFFTASEGLCVPHYKKLLLVVKKVPLWLEKQHLKKFEALEKRVRSFIECSAWGRQDEFKALSDADKIVWKELALNLRGKSQ